MNVVLDVRVVMFCVSGRGGVRVCALRIDAAKMHPLM
jgi:hypothetical protein